MLGRMALFGLVWLLRVRGASCTCATCRRVRHDADGGGRHDIHAGTGDDDPDAGINEAVPEAVECDVTAHTCDVTVQTDFNDDDDSDVLHELTSLDIKDVEVTSASEVANQTSSPQPTLERVSQTIKTKIDDENDKESIWEYEDVTLYRDSLGLGFSITGGAAAGTHPIGSKSDGEVRITRIADDGAAARDARLRLDDVILQVNGVSVAGAAHAVAVESLQKAGNCVTLHVRRARGVRHVSLCRGAWPGIPGAGFGLGVAGGRDCPRRRGDPSVYVTHVAPQLQYKLTPGDRILAVRDDLYGERLLLNVTHAEAVEVLHSASDNITLVVTPVSRDPGSQFTVSASPVSGDVTTARCDRILYSQRSQATSCSTLHEIVETEEILDIPRYIRVVKLKRSGSKLGMDIMGGGGCDDINWQNGPEMEPSIGVFVSRCAPGGSADGQLYRGDRILSVDGQDLTTASHEQAAAALKCTGTTVVIEAQYQPEEYARLRAKIRALNIKTGEQGLYNR